MERLLNIEVTSNCNANCSMCPRENVKEFGYISFETLNKIIEKAKDYELFEVSISGRGEPTFHPQLVEILKELKKLPAKKSVVTTTDGINESNYKAIVDNLDIIRISVSSIDRTAFKKIHTGLDYDKIWNNIRLLISYRPEKINIHLVGGQDTYESLEETIKFFKENGVNNMFLFPLWNRGGSIEEQQITELRKRIVEKYNIFYSEDEYLPHEKAKLLLNPTYCPLGDKSIVVNFNGDMIGCFQDFANETKICNVNDRDTDFIREREKALKRMPVCRACNSSLVARK